MKWWLILLAVVFVLWLLLKLIESHTKLKNTAKRIVENRICPYCKSEVLKTASVCKYCQRDLPEYKEPTREELVEKRKEREDTIVGVLETYSNQYHEYEFSFDDKYHKINISTKPKLQAHLKNIRDKLVASLVEKGIEAKGTLLDSSTINTIGLLDNAMERTLEELENMSDNPSEQAARNEPFDYQKEFTKVDLNSSVFSNRWLISACAILVIIVFAIAIYTTRTITVENNLSFDEYLSTGINSYEHGDYKKAIAYLDMAIEMNPDSQKAYYYRGYSKLNTGEEIGAKPDIRKSEALAFKYNAIAKSEMGDNVGAQEYYTKALNIYSQAIWDNVEDADAYYERALLEIELGKISDACKDFNIAKNLGHTRTDHMISKYCY